MRKCMYSPSTKINALIPMIQCKSEMFVSCRTLFLYQPSHTVVGGIDFRCLRCLAKHLQMRVLEMEKEHVRPSDGICVLFHLGTQSKDASQINSTARGYITVYLLMQELWVGTQNCFSTVFRMQMSCWGQSNLKYVNCSLILFDSEAQGSKCHYEACDSIWHSGAWVQNAN
jgi:hypothetical protein